MLRQFLDFTTFSGRMPRLEYWKYVAATILIGLIQSLAQIGFAQVLQGGKALIYINTFVMAAGTVAALIVFFSALVRRLRDVNLSPYWAFAYVLTTYYWPVAVAAVAVIGLIPTYRVKPKSG